MLCLLRCLHLNCSFRWSLGIISKFHDILALHVVSNKMFYNAGTSQCLIVLIVWVNDQNDECSRSLWHQSIGWPLFGKKTRTKFHETLAPHADVLYKIICFLFSVITKVGRMSQEDIMMNFSLIAPPIMGSQYVEAQMNVSQKAYFVTPFFDQR